MTEVIAVMGPTATGKSALAVQIAQRFDGEILNADALQVYRGLDIGTAKPTLEERSVVPHHLFDIVDPDETYSAGRYVRDAREMIAKVQSRGRRPILVGGSGLYIRAALEGLSPLPPSDPGIRAALEEKLALEGLDPLRADLAKVDPATHARLAVGDTQRTLRALEVCLITGSPMSDWLKQQAGGQDSIEAIRVGLTLDRSILYDRIESRVRLMIERGWLAEVQALMAQGYGAETRAFQAIGYRQLVRHLVEGESLEAVMEETLRETRRFAKRQQTWFKKEAKVQWFEAEQGAHSAVLDYLMMKGIRELHGET